MTAPSAVVHDLFLAHRASLLPYLSRIVGDPHRGEDVLQETMLRTHLYADRLWSDETARKAWLFRVGHNVAVDHAAAAERRTVAMGGTDDLPAWATADPMPDVVNRVDVVRAVRRLSPTQRRVIFEIYYRGRTVAGAAEVIGVSTSTASTHLHAALKRLRGYLR